MDVTNRESGSREMHEEVAVYTVKNGKVVREEFMAGTSRPVERSTIVETMPRASEPVPF